MICQKCNRKDFPEWEIGVTYEGLDKHHNPPEEISRFLKEEWKGEIFLLCRKCHQELHREITKILKKFSTKPNYNSDYWLMSNSTIKKIKEAQKEIYDFTKIWIKENDTNSR